MHRFEILIAGVLLAALIGCSGGAEPAAPEEEAPAVEVTPEATSEAVAVADDDDSAADDDDSGADEAVAAVEAAADDDDSAAGGAVAAADASAEVEEPTSAPEDPGAEQTGKPDDPAPKPREEGKDAPYQISLVGSTRTSATEGEIMVSVRGEAEVANGIKWTTTGSVSGPKKTAGKEDSTYTWTVKGLGKAAATGSITGAYGKWTQKLDWELPAPDAPPPPSPKEDPPAPE